MGDKQRDERRHGMRLVVDVALVVWRTVLAVWSWSQHC